MADPIKLPPGAMLVDDGQMKLPPGAKLVPGGEQQPDITANPNGEGVYKMTGPNGPVGIPYSNVLHAQKTGYKLDPADHQRFLKDYTGSPTADNGATPPPTFGSVLKGAAGEVKNIGKGLAGLVAPPADATEKAADLLGPGAVPLLRMGKGIVQGEKTAAHQTAQYTKDANAVPWSAPVDKALAMGRAGVSALSMADPIDPAGAAGINSAFDNGDDGEALGSGLVHLGALTAPGEIAKIGRGAKGFLAGDVDKPMAGSDTTPRERYEGAKDLGVDLPPAQATNSGPLKAFDRINREGLLSAPMHERLNATNVGKLTQATDGTLGGMSPFEPGARDQAGARLQSLAKTTQEGLHNEATQQFQDVQDKYGDTPVSNPAGVTDMANEILKKNERFSKQFPSLQSKKVANVVQDAAKLGGENQAELGPPTVGDMMRTRSGLLDMTRDPEIVKSAHLADIQRLVSAHDQAIMDSLPSEGQDAWRDANGNWEAMKGTFDNPSSPYFHAVRTETPSTLVKGIGGPTPEGVGKLRQMTGDEGVGIVQRGVAEDLLGDTKDGAYNFPKFAGRFARMPEAYRAALFGDDGSAALKKIGSTADALDTNYNRSGSGTQTQKVLEAGALGAAGAGAFVHPAAALGAVPALMQYPLGKFMTSPAVSEWLMKRSAPSPFVAPAGPVIAAARKRDEANQ